MIFRQDLAFILGILVFPTLLLPASCSSGEIVRAARLAATGDVAGAGRMAAERSTRYALEPEAIGEDLRCVKAVLDRFRERVDGEWGPEEAREPSPEEYVKYTQNYLSRAFVNFNGAS